MPKGVADDKTGHLGGTTASLHSRADTLRERAINLGFTILKECGPFSPRYSQSFDRNGNMCLDEGTTLALADIVLSGLEPRVAIFRSSRSIKTMALH